MPLSLEETKQEKPLPFDVGAFEESLLQGDEGLAYVFLHLEKAVYSGETQSVLTYLLSKQYLFEYIYSIADEAMASKFHESLAIGFNLELCLVTEPTISALERIAEFALFELSDLKDANKQELKDRHNDVRKLKMSLECEMDSHYEFTGKKLAKKPKYSSNRKSGKSIQTSGFNALKERQRALERLMVLLKELLDVLRDRQFSERIKEIFIASMNAEKPVPLDPTVKSDDSPATETTTLVETPEAYLPIQPLKAALYFASAEGLGQWRIFISSRGISYLRRHRGQNTFDILFKKIVELSNGFFSHDNHKRLKGWDIPIFEARLSKDLRLVYQIDCISDYNGVNCQVIRIYGFFTHAQMDRRMWDSISKQLTNRGGEYCKRIKSRRRGTKSDYYLPQSWPDSYEVQDEAHGLCIVPHTEHGNMTSVHEWLVLEKYSAFSQNLLDQIKSGKDAMPVFAVSSYERDIIGHPSSCYVLGRSGTGKTTTMVFKMLGIERAGLSSTDNHKPRQLFVTRSNVLTKRVKEYFMKLMNFVKSTAINSEDTSKSFGNKNSSFYLDDLDEEHSKELPKRFSELNDAHFPLFLTFEKLITLLETDLDISYAIRAGVKHLGATAANRDRSKVDSCGRLVTFDVFHKDYWPHLPQYLTNKLNPASVFSEIIGVIKGSKQTLLAEEGYLSKESYLSLSERTQFLFQRQRECIYELFLKYLAKKGEYRDYDSADRTHAVLHLMKEKSWPLIDFLFVDETQDNLIIDAFLLRYLCRNPHGLFWAGDTAQTIFVGSSFRFDDLKASLHEFEREIYPTISEKNVVKPKSFQLTTNYRSHDGIVSCADTIIRLITHFWPDAIDILRRERGLVDGLKPVFFDGWNDEATAYRDFLSGENDNQFELELGAQQCILVRNEKTKESLLHQIGKKTELIMTLYESKGLEFDDVILFQFFEDSPYNAHQWRVVLNFQNGIDTNTNAPRFDEARHSGLCTELKFFYVAITRARKNVWIIDRTDKGEAMKAILLRTGSITTCSPENAPPLTVASSCQDWEETGKMLFQDNKYSQAAYCFKRAGRILESDVCDAFYLRKEARGLPRLTKPDKRKDLFISAAKSFYRCAEKMVTEEESAKLYQSSADCYQEASDFPSAARTYKLAGSYQESVICYMECGDYDEAVKIVRSESEGETIEPSVKEEVIVRSKVYYLKNKELEKASPLFDSIEEFIEFMVNFGFNIERAEFLKKIKRLDEAATIYYSEGKIQDAICLLIHDEQNLIQSKQRAAKYLLQELWKQFRFGFPPHHEEYTKPDLWDLHGRLLEKSNLLMEDTINELRMFGLMRKKDVTALLGCCKEFSSNRAVVALVLDHVLGVTMTKPANADKMIEYLQNCCTYTKVMRQFWFENNASSDVYLQKLFAFQMSSEGEYFLHEYSLVAEYISVNNLTILRRSGKGVYIFKRGLEQAIRLTIETHLQRRMESHISFFSTTCSKVFKGPCLHFTLRGYCKYYNTGTCDLEHIDTNLRETNTRSAWFNKRIRMHILLVMYWKLADFSLLRISDRTKTQGKWISYFFQTLYPSFPALGDADLICRDLIPELDGGIKDIFSILQLRFQQLLPRQITTYWFLNTIIETIVLARGWHPNEKSSLVYPLVNCLTTFFEMRDSQFIIAGCRFIELVLTNKLLVNLQYLSYILQMLCGSSAVILKHMDNFHGCLLPKSWIAYIFSKANFNRKLVLNREDAMLLLGQCESFILLLLYQLDEEYLEKCRASSLTTRKALVKVILDSICFLGENAPPYYARIRTDILDLFSRINNAVPSVSYDSLLRPYFRTGSWPDIRSELAWPRQVQFGELMQLDFLGNPVRVEKNIHSTLFKFRSEMDLRSFGFSFSSSYGATTAPATPTTIERRTQDRICTSNQSNKFSNKCSEDVNSDPKKTEVYTSKKEQGQLTKSTEETDNVLGEMLNSEALAYNTESDGTLDQKATQVVRLVLNYWDDLRKDRAAFVIQGHYRTARMRKEAVDSRISQMRIKFHGICMATASNTNWLFRKHRVIYLAVVPHLFICLDALQDHLSDKKRMWNNALRRNGPDTDDSIIVTNIQSTLDRQKYLDRVQRELGNVVDKYGACKIDGLKETALEISRFVDEFKLEKVKLDMCLASKALRNREPLRKTRGARPGLNVDDRAMY